jgi:hypothetical protein
MDHAKELLLQWGRKRLGKYANTGVSISDLSRSWQDGLAFCALLHSYHPNLVKFDSLDRKQKESNLKLAFTVASKLGVPKLLDEQDFLNNVNGLDESTIMDFLLSLYDLLEKGGTSGRTNDVSKGVLLFCMKSTLYNENTVWDFVFMDVCDDRIVCAVVAVGACRV